jgi:ATP-dependent DNA ligase
VLDGEIVVLDETGDFQALQYFGPASASGLFDYA